MQDELFKADLAKQFEFDASVAAAFDDMAKRSIPFYEENIKLISSLCAKIAKKRAKACELGCSTANMLLALYEKRQDLCLSGFDNSSFMLAKAREKASLKGANIAFKEANLLKCKLDKNDIFILNYTLQFIRPLYREELMAKIYKALNKNGLLILSEKISYDDAFLANKIINIYEDYKEEQGYLRDEIARKRQALENVLVPFSEDENKQLLSKVGFINIQSIFKWANFITLIAFKS